MNTIQAMQTQVRNILNAYDAETVDYMDTSVAILELIETNKKSAIAAIWAIDSGVAFGFISLADWAGLISYYDMKKEFKRFLKVSSENYAYDDAEWLYVLEVAPEFVKYCNLEYFNFCNFDFLYSVILAQPSLYRHAVKAGITFSKEERAEIKAVHKRRIQLKNAVL